jgi:mono/diheme cytochrome c family protein
MKRIFGVLVGIGFLATCAPVSAQDKVEQGSALFTSQKCVMCHSVAGKGNKKGALDDVGARLKADEIRAWLTNPDAMREKTKATRTPAMKDPKLGKDQVDALVAFLSAQKNAAAR